MQWKRDSNRFNVNFKRMVRCEHPLWFYTYFYKFYFEKNFKRPPFLDQKNEYFQIETTVYQVTFTLTERTLEHKCTYSYISHLLVKRVVVEVHFAESERGVVELARQLLLRVVSSGKAAGFAVVFRTRPWNSKRDAYWLSMFRRQPHQRRLQHFCWRF